MLVPASSGCPGIVEDKMTVGVSYGKDCTLLFNIRYFKPTRVSRVPECQTILHSNTARDNEGSGDASRNSLTSAKLLSDHHHHHQQFFTGQVRFLPPNQQNQSTERKATAKIQSGTIQTLRTIFQSGIKPLSIHP